MMQGFFMLLARMRVPACARKFFCLINSSFKIPEMVLIRYRIN